MTFLNTIRNFGLVYLATYVQAKPTSLQENKNSTDISKSLYFNSLQCHTQAKSLPEEELFYKHKDALFNQINNISSIHEAESLKSSLSELSFENFSKYTVSEIGDMHSSIDKFINNRIKKIVNDKVYETDSKDKVSPATSKDKALLIKLIKEARKNPLAKFDIDFVLEHPDFKLYFMTGSDFYLKVKDPHVQAAYMRDTVDNKFYSFGIIFKKDDLIDAPLVGHEFHHAALNYAQRILSPKVKNVFFPYYPNSIENKNKFEAILKMGDRNFARFIELLDKEDELLDKEKQFLNKKSNLIESEVQELQIVKGEIQELQKFKDAAKTCNNLIPITLNAEQSKDKKVGEKYNFDDILGMNLGNVQIMKIEKYFFVKPLDRVNAVLIYKDFIEKSLENTRYSVDPVERYIYEKDAHLRQFFSEAMLAVFYPGLVQTSIDTINQAREARNLTF